MYFMSGDTMNDERWTMIMDRIQIILVPLSLHFIIHVDSFLIFYISVEHKKHGS